MRKDMAGGDVVPVHSHIPIIIHIPAQWGGVLALSVDNNIEDLGLVPYPVPSTTGPGPGRKENPQLIDSWEQNQEFWPLWLKVKPCNF